LRILVQTKEGVLTRGRKPDWQTLPWHL